MRLNPYLVMLLAAVVCTGAFADSDDVPADIAAKLRATLKERVPELRIEGIHKGPIPGLYELNAGSELLRKTAREIGLPAWDVVWGRRGMQSIGLELSGDQMAER